MICHWYGLWCIMGVDVMYSLGDTKAVVVEKAKQRISKQHSV